MAREQHHVAGLHSDREPHEEARVDEKSGGHTLRDHLRRLVGVHEASDDEWVVGRLHQRWRRVGRVPILFLRTDFSLAPGVVGRWGY